MQQRRFVIDTEIMLKYRYHVRQSSRVPRILSSVKAIEILPVVKQMMAKSSNIDTSLAISII